MTGICKRLFSSPFHKKEFRNYIHFIIRRGEIPALFLNLGRYFSARMLRDSIPQEYRQVAEYLGRTTSFTKDEMGYGSAGILGIAKPPITDWNRNISSIFLATRTIDLSTPNCWHASFNDEEDIFSLHRFGWLLPIISSGISHSEWHELKDLIVAWIRANPYKDQNVGWDSYSVSERIVNWIIIISAIKGVILERDEKIRAIYQSISEQTKILWERLEFRGSATNNHLINNGRALYLAGAFLNNNKVLETGREILRSTGPNMFTGSGFLREGSSHYQILLARTFMEVLWCAGAISDRKLTRDLFDFTKRVVNCAEYFLSEDPFPIFGDISPDFPPDFHSGLSSVAELLFNDSPCPKARDYDPVTGWHKLFVFPDSRAYNYKTGKQNASAFNSPEVISYPDAGHYKIITGSYCIYIYSNPLGYVPEWSHGHSDLGGFVMYWHGQPFLVDCGRLNFQNTSKGSYGRSVRSHNSISIDGYEPCITHGLNGFAQLMLKEYIGPPPEVKITESHNTVKVQIELSGFKRIQKDIIIRRTLYCEPKKVFIEDEISGSGTHQIETFFHFYPAIEPALAGRNEFRCTLATGKKMEISAIGDQTMLSNIFRGAKDPIYAGWYSPRYGQQIANSTIIFRQATTLPAKNRFALVEI